MYVRRIPRKLLMHTATHLWGKTVDEWDNETYTQNRVLKRIRIEPSTSLKRGKDNNQVQLTAVLFYCPINSNPQGVEFDLDDRVTFDGNDYTIVNIDKLYDNAKLHHIELGLI